MRDEDTVIKFLTNQVDLKQLSWVILLTAGNWQLAAVLANIQEVQFGLLKEAFRHRIQAIGQHVGLLIGQFSKRYMVEGLCNNVEQGTWVGTHMPHSTL